MAVRTLVVAGAAALLLGGCGGTGSEELEALLDYMDRQVEALEPAVQGDVTAGTVNQAVAISEDARHHTDPGNSDGEWVGELVWLAPLSDCQAHLEADGVSAGEALETCRTAMQLWGAARDLAYFTDQSNADEDEYWDEDRDYFFSTELPGTVEDSRELVG